MHFDGNSYVFSKIAGWCCSLDIPRPTKHVVSVQEPWHGPHRCVGQTDWRRKTGVCTSRPVAAVWGLGIGLLRTHEKPWVMRWGGCIALKIHTCQPSFSLSHQGFAISFQMCWNLSFGGCFPEPTGCSGASSLILEKAGHTAGHTYFFQAPSPQSEWSLPTSRECFRKRTNRTRLSNTTGRTSPSPSFPLHLLRLNVMFHSNRGFAHIGHDRIIGEARRIVSRWAKTEGLVCAKRVGLVSNMYITQQLGEAVVYRITLTSHFS